MAPGGLLLLLEEPRVPFDISGANIRAMVVVDRLRRLLKFEHAKRCHKLKLKAGESLRQVGSNLFLSKPSAPNITSNKRSHDEADPDAMDVDVTEPVEERPIKRGRVGVKDLPRSMRDRLLRFPALTMRIRSASRSDIFVRQGSSGGTVQVMVRAQTQPQPSIRPRWRPNDTRPKFSIGDLETLGKSFYNACYYHYALRLTLRPEDIPRHAGLLEHQNLEDEYMLPLDSADCGYWFHRDNFEIIPTTTVLPAQPLETPQIPDATPVPQGDPASVVDDVGLDIDGEASGILSDDLETWFILFNNDLDVTEEFEVPAPEFGNALTDALGYAVELDEPNPEVIENLPPQQSPSAGLEIQLDFADTTGDLPATVDDAESPEHEEPGQDASQVTDVVAALQPAPVAGQPEPPELPLFPPAKKTIPPGSDDTCRGVGHVDYRDGGEVELRRWAVNDSAIPMNFPSWNWNARAGEATMLELPRVLASKVGWVTALQPGDGNLGLGVPGWRQESWKDAKPEDQVTFFDVLQHNEQVRVDKPWIVTLRFLWPQERSTTEIASTEMDKSFVYFGSGSPCAMLGTEDIPIPPQWGPPIPIYPDNFRDNLFATWNLRLLSMTLLVPRVENPDYASLDDWDPTEIVLPSLDGLEGLNVVLDTLTSISVLPPAVFDEVVTKWLKDPVICKGDDTTPSTVFIPDPAAYDNYDLVLKFLGSNGVTFDFRCGARNFLVSPYKSAVGHFAPFGPLTEEEMSPYAWPRTPGILGVNFFWTAMTKLVAPPHDGTKGGWDLLLSQRPYVQLAPQRIIRDGKKVGGPRDIELYEEFPPWHQPPHHEAAIV